MSKLAAYFILMAYLAAFPNVAQADDEDHQLTCYVCTSKTISIPPYNTITASQKCEGQQDTEFLQLVPETEEKHGYCVTVEGNAIANGAIGRYYALLTTDVYNALGLDGEGCKMEAYGKVCYCHGDKCNKEDKAGIGAGIEPTVAPAVDKSSPTPTRESSDAPDPTEASSSTPKATVSPGPKESGGSTTKAKGSASLVHVNLFVLMLQLIMVALLCL